MRDQVSIPRVEELHPKIKDEVASGISSAEILMGNLYAVRVVQGLRTIEYQNQLYNQPYDHIDNDHDGKIDEADEKVTNAKGGSSYHNYGLAFDFCILFLNTETGKYYFDPNRSWEVNKQWMIVVDVFKNMGYIWGADWDNDGITKAEGDKDEHLVDSPHLQKTFGLNWRDMLKKYNDKDFIPGTKYINI